MKHRLKFLLLLHLLLGLTPAVVAQYGFGTNAPAKGAAVDLTSITKGFLLPRMDKTQLDKFAATSPTEGMLVYNTTEHCLAYYSQGAFNCVSVPVLPVATNVTCGPSMKVGATLTASYFYSHALGTPAGTPKFAWYSSTSANGAGKTSLGVSTQTYTLPTGQVGNYIAVGVTPVASDGKEGVEVVSDYKQVIAAGTQAAPYVSSISYTASVPTVCSKLTVSAACNDEDSPVSASVINWYYCTDAAGNGRTSSVGTGDSYTLKTADLGKYLIAGVTPQSTIAPLAGTEVFASNAIGPVTNELIINHVSSDGVSPVNTQITYELTNIDTRCWLKQDLGAPHPNSEAGWYFIFGLSAGYKPGVSVKPATWPPGDKPQNFANGTTWTGLGTDPCTKALGGTWHVASSVEMSSVLQKYFVGLMLYYECLSTAGAEFGICNSGSFVDPLKTSATYLGAGGVENHILQGFAFGSFYASHVWGVNDGQGTADRNGRYAGVQVNTDDRMPAVEAVGGIEYVNSTSVMNNGVMENTGVPVRCVRDL